MSKYVTVQGDMWDSIAYKVLGSVNYTDALINANLEHRKVYVFSAGVELNIPEVEDVATGNNLPPWKQVSG